MYAPIKIDLNMIDLADNVLEILHGFVYVYKVDYSLLCMKMWDTEPSGRCSVKTHTKKANVFIILKNNTGRQLYKYCKLRI